MSRNYYRKLSASIYHQKCVNYRETDISKNTKYIDNKSAK